MYIDLATKLNIKTVPQEKPLLVWALDNHILHCTTCKLVLFTCLYIITTKIYRFILSTHFSSFQSLATPGCLETTPHIDWSSGTPPICLLVSVLHLSPHPALRLQRRRRRSFLTLPLCPRNISTSKRYLTCPGPPLCLPTILMIVGSTCCLAPFHHGAGCIQTQRPRERLWRFTFKTP